MKNIKKFVFMELLCLVAFGVVFVGISDETGVDPDLFQFEKTPVYEEWRGKYSPEEINTRIQIYDIGRRLGRGIHYQESVQNDPFPFVKGNPAYKYSAARIYGDKKRGADIIYIGTTATVDTIKCLRMIVSGYLQEAFALDAQKADDMALTAIYWNTAVYDKIDFFNEEFDERVMEVYSDRTKKMGLAADYREWPGASKIVIPHIFIAPTPVVEPVKEESIKEEPPAPVAQSIPEPPIQRVTEPVQPPKRDFNVVSVEPKPKKYALPLPLLISIIVVVLAMIAAFIILIIRNLDAMRDSDDDSEKKGA